MSDPYTGDASFEATPVVSRLPPPTRPPSLNQQGDRHQFSNKREAPSPSISVEESRQKPKIHRTLSSPKMAIQNLLHSSGSLYRSCVDIPPANTSVNWYECTRAQRVDTLTPGKDLVLRLVQVDVPKDSPFIDKEVAASLEQGLKAIIKVPAAKFRAARSKAHPYEALGKSIFLTRDAVKLANIDFLADVTEGCNEDEPFYFADLCSGPGGFTDYLLWKASKKGSKRAHGFGMTLKGSMDFSYEYLLKHRERFESVYGADKTGSLYKSENLSDFAQYVRERSGGEGAHLVVAGGALKMKDQDALFHEFHLKQLVLCETLCMFKVLRQGGQFVLKTYDIMSSFTAGIVYLLYQSFDKVAIIKPWTSRSSNSERFIVCKGFIRTGCEPLIAHLTQVNEQMNHLFETLLPDYTQTLPEYIFFGRHVKQSHSTVDEIVPLDVMTKDEDFMDYLQISNMRWVVVDLALRSPPSCIHARLAVEQTNAIADLLGYVNDDKKTEYDQNSIRARCIEKWGFVNEPTSLPSKETNGLTLFATTDPSVFQDQVEKNSGW